MDVYCAGVETSNLLLGVGSSLVLLCFFVCLLLRSLVTSVDGVRGRDLCQSPLPSQPQMWNPAVLVLLYISRENCDETKNLEVT